MLAHSGGRPRINQIMYSKAKAVPLVLAVAPDQELPISHVALCQTEHLMHPISLNVPSCFVSRLYAPSLSSCMAWRVVRVSSGPCLLCSSRCDAACETREYAVARGQAGPLAPLRPASWHTSLSSEAVATCKRMQAHGVGLPRAGLRDGAEGEVGVRQPMLHRAL